MENSESSPPPGSAAAPREDVEKSAGQLSESARPPRHRQHRTKSPRRHQKGTKLQRRMGDQEQLSRDADQRRLPGQREHSESSGSPGEPMEISPKRLARRLPAATGTCLLSQTLGNSLDPVCVFPYFTGEHTFYMDHTQPPTSDLKPVFFPTQLQLCKHEGAEAVMLGVCELLAGDFDADTELANMSR